jgi:hypothetical protein
MKTIILKDTYVSGRSFPKGAVVDLSEANAATLALYKKAVPFHEASDEQKKLIKADAQPGPKPKDKNKSEDKE